MQSGLLSNVRGAAALVLFVACGCSGDDASQATAPSDGGSAPQDAATAADGGTQAQDAAARDASDGATRDSASSDSGNGEPGPGPTQQCAMTKDADNFFKLTSSKSDYWARLPASYDVQSPKPTALLVAIHGCGDTAYNFATWGAVPYALRASQDYIAISIGGRDGQCWTVPQDAAIVNAAIAHARSCFYVHQKKIVLGGYSSGGELSYAMGMTSAASYAGILIENSGLSQGIGGANNVDGVLSSAAWKINVAHSAHLQDASFPIAGVQADRDKMLAAGFPLQYREQAGDHNGTSDDWALFLIPKMGSWTAP